MSAGEWKRVAIINAGDAVGSALARFFVAAGADVLVVDDQDGLQGLEAGVHRLPVPEDAEWDTVQATIRDGIASWGRPQLLINNFGRDFLTAHMDDEAPEWGVVDDTRLRRGFAALSAVLASPEGASGTFVVNVGSGKGLQPEGCPMHYTLLGLMRSLRLAGAASAEMANVCLHNQDSARPECFPCAEEVLYSAPIDERERVREVGKMVLDAIREHRQG